MLALMSGSARPSAAAENSLIGADLDEVRARFGPPLRCAPLGNDGAWLWVYRDHDGRVVSPAITSIDDVVVAAHDRLAPNPPNDDNRWHGASIEEVTAALGPGRIEARDTTAVRVRFGELAFEFVAGRVLRRAD